MAKKFGKILLGLTVASAAGVGAYYWFKKSFRSEEEEEFDEDFDTSDFELDDDLGEVPQRGYTPLNPSPAAKEKLEDAKDAAEDAAESAKEAVSDASDAAKDIAEDTLKTVKQKAADTAKIVKEKAADTAKNVKEIVSETAKAVKEKAAKAAEEADAAVEEMMNSAEETAEKMKSEAADTVGDVKEAASEIAEDVKETAAETAADALEAEAAFHGLALHPVMGRLHGKPGYVAFQRLIRTFAGGAAVAVVHKKIPPVRWNFCGCAPQVRSAGAGAGVFIVCNGPQALFAGHCLK